MHANRHHSSRTGGGIEALALPEADSETSFVRRGSAGFNTRISLSDKSGMAGGRVGDSQRAPTVSVGSGASPSGVDISHP